MKGVGVGDRKDRHDLAQSLRLELGEPATPAATCAYPVFWNPKLALVGTRVLLSREYGTATSTSFMNR